MNYEEFFKKEKITRLKFERAALFVSRGYTNDPHGIGFRFLNIALTHGRTRTCQQAIKALIKFEANSHAP